MARYKSYRLKDDSIEDAIRSLNSSITMKVKLRDSIDEYRHKIEEAEKDLATTLEDIEVKEAKVVELLSRSKKSIIVDCVKYSLSKEGKLIKELIID